MLSRDRSSLVIGAAVLLTFTVLAIADKYTMFFRSYDAYIINYVRSLPPDFMYVFSVVSAVASIVFVWGYVLLLTVLSLTMVKKLRKIIPQLIITLLIVELLTAATKFIVGIPRPSVALIRGAVLSGNSVISNLFLSVELMSYPSGHVARFTALAYVLRRYSRILATLLYILIPVIAASRVLLGEHYCIDVIGGFLLGLGVSLVVNSLMGEKIRKAKVR